MFTAGLPPADPLWPCLLTAPQLRQRVGEDASAKGGSSKSGSSKSSSSKAAPEEDDSGYQDAQDALEEMIEEVGLRFWSCEGCRSKEHGGLWRGGDLAINALHWHQNTCCIGS